MSISGTLRDGKLTYQAHCDRCPLRSPPWQPDDQTTTADQFREFIGWTLTDDDLDLCQPCAHEDAQRPAPDYWVAAPDPTKPLECQTQIETMDSLPLAYFTARTYEPPLMVVRNRDLAQLVSINFKTNPGGEWRLLDGSLGP